MKAAVKITTENPELADRFNRVLEHTVEALQDSGVRYVFIGGIASGGLGRPRSTHDIDVFVQPEDAEIALRALAKHGFRTEKTDPVWLYKGFKEDILVDIIFKSKGDIYLDAEMYQRAAIAEFHGKRLKLVSPEDLVIIKAAAHSEVTPGHWHDALALLSHAEIDWSYLLKRARRAPRRVLSLLLYAHSIDIAVPRYAIDSLYRVVYGDENVPSGPSTAPSASTAAAPVLVPPPPKVEPEPPAEPSRTHAPVAPYPPAAPAPVRRPPLTVVSGQAQRAPGYLLAKLRESLAEDPRTNELDIQLESSGEKVLLRGEIVTEERLRAVVDIAREIMEGYEVVNQLRLVELKESLETEDVR